jgi:hypothetical protein
MDCLISQPVTKHTLHKSFCGGASKVLQYNLVFLLKQHVMFALSFSPAQNLFEICLPVDVLLISKEVNRQDSDFWIFYDIFSNQHCIIRYMLGGLTINEGS